MHTPTDAARYWIGLSSIPGVGRATFRKLVLAFSTPERVLAASADDLKKVDGLSDKIVQELLSGAWREAAEREVGRARDAGVAVITIDDPSYPENLRTAPDPPPFLYVRGALLPRDRAAVAIVGTRNPTHYGKTVTHCMAQDLAAAGVTIVSGMARGIDTQAHRGALAAKGRTVAVLGSGIDVPYPPENRGLLEEIALSGAVVTENPFGTRPEAGYFPARNRIISGLSRGTVIVEAAADSGSLVTADYTLKQGRKLFAVPGNIGSPVSRGTNSLIKEGAALIEGAGDVLRALSLTAASGGVSARGAMPELSADEAAVFGSLSAEPKHIDVITAETGRSPAKIGGTLVTLELKGLAKQLPGKYFVKDAQAS
jgi:DNA processing protein